MEYFSHLLFPEGENYLDELPLQNYDESMATPAENLPLLDLSDEFITSPSTNQQLLDLSDEYNMVSREETGNLDVTDNFMTMESIGFDDRIKTLEDNLSDVKKELNELKEANKSMKKSFYRMEGIGRQNCLLFRNIPKVLEIETRKDLYDIIYSLIFRHLDGYMLQRYVLKTIARLNGLGKPILVEFNDCFVREEIYRRWKNKPNIHQQLNIAPYFNDQTTRIRKILTKHGRNSNVKFVIHDDVLYQGGEKFVIDGDSEIVRLEESQNLREDTKSSTSYLNSREN